MAAQSTASWGRQPQDFNLDNKLRARMGIRFSDYFKLKKSQAELDFVDIPLNTDIPLFVDPYALSITDEPWFTECNGLVVGYFQLLVNSIRKGNNQIATSLLQNLHEPNDTHLGFSKGKPSGRGIGHEQASDLFNRLKASKAVRTGKLRDLNDCELMIPGISSDKISDMTINIIRGKLVEYTELQCELLKLPVRQTASGLCWDISRNNWVNRYANLPIYNGRRIILVPKASVRYRVSVDHQKYYQHFVLEYLQAEHLNAGSSLVTVLKNGKRKVHKKDLKGHYPCSKDFLFEFSEDHPEVLEAYKASLLKAERVLDNDDIERLQLDPRQIDLLKLNSELKSIPPGGEAANQYHDLVIGVLESIFFPSLRKPVKEQEVHEGRKRIDIVFNNGAKEGL